MRGLKGVPEKSTLSAVPRLSVTSGLLYCGRPGAGFVPVRKKDKLPWHTESAEYSLEYGTATVEIHRDAIVPGERVLVVDDVLATGGTARATADIVERIGGKIVGIACLIELGFLNGRSRLEGYDLFTLLSY